MLSHAVHSPRSKRLLTAIVVLTLVAAPLALVLYKVVGLQYSFASVLPVTRYRVSYDMMLDGASGGANVRAYVPLSDTRQMISDEQIYAPHFHVARRTGLNREIVWSAGTVPDGGRIEYSFAVLAQAVSYDIDDQLTVPHRYPLSVAQYLRSEPRIQVDDPAIREMANGLQLDTGPLLRRLNVMYQVLNTMPTRPFTATTDAVTALLVGEANASGKAHLFVALARSAGIPARVVGGVVLSETPGQRHHQWAEVYIAGHWVPVCPTNRYFAELPNSYLTIYRNDGDLFQHADQVHLQADIRVRTDIVPAPSAFTAFGSFNVWGLFQRLDLPFSLLRTMLMLPVGALFVVFFRNVIGVPTFGTFLPALIAAAATHTGLLWGTLGIIIVMVIVASIRMLLGRLELLHSPTLAILLWAVVMTMLATSLVADHLGLMGLARISVFPIAVIAIAAERFYLVSHDHSMGRALKELSGTLAVVTVCYLMMSSLALQMLLSGFPELLLCVVAANIYLGRWVGMRVSEYIRFRHLVSDSHKSVS